MPGNILNADTGFPQFTGDESSDAKIDKVMNYLYMLLEQLRYSLNNLDADNFNDTGLRKIGEGIARPLQTSFENEFSKTNALIEGISDEFGSQIRLLTDWVGTDADGNLISSAAKITQSVNANAASIVQLNQWKSTASTSLVEVQSLASQNEAKISSLTSWKDTAEGEIDGLAASVAAIDQIADENGASISQIVEAVGSEGIVNAASIVAAVNAAGSSVKIDADHLDVDAFVTFSNLENSGQTTVNGNNISLIATAEGDSISRLAYRKWRYSNEDYNTTDNTLNTMFEIKTVDNESDDSNYARFATMLQTHRCYQDSTRYYTALKLISAGAMSLESEFSIYALAGTYCTIDAGWNTRIRANATRQNSNIEYPMSNNDYSFNTDGIYYGSTLLLSTDGGSGGNGDSLSGTNVSLDADTDITLSAGDDVSITAEDDIFIKGGYNLDIDVVRKIDMYCGRALSLEGGYGVRIFAGEDYDYYDDSSSVADFTYIFCADGIYFNGIRIVSTPS